MTDLSTSVGEVTTAPAPAPGSVARQPGPPSVAVVSPRDVFADARSASTVLRASWHDGLGCVVLSLWRCDRCVATFHLPAEDVDRLVEVLGAAAVGPARTAVVPAVVEPVA